jgi:ATP-dependent Zn protease
VKEIELNVTQLLTSHRSQLDALANTLLEKETLSAAEIRQLVTA